ncbi:helix-turn-helix domain-containing protein [Nocardioides currus]|nr:helix-turn-helix transcriptional regulator [Nocardioides currus]
MKSRTSVIETARRAAGMSQAELAYGARTAQSAVSEYESGRKSPTLAVTERLLAAAKADLVAVPRVEFFWAEEPDGRVFYVPDRLWSVPPPLCFARVRLFGTESLGKRAVFDLSKRPDRIQFYQLVLAIGFPEMIQEVVDGALLVDLWEELTLSDAIREAWDPLITAAKGRRDTVRTTSPALEEDK